MSSTLAVIPARYQSTRFPGKPLAAIAGKSMIQRVYEQAQKVSLIDEIVVATDDARIAEVVTGFGGQACMTSKDHETGTDRIAEVIASKTASWVLNLQGDEPLVSPQDLDALIAQAQERQAAMATLVFPIMSDVDKFDPNIVKVVLNQQQEALYFSRSPIPAVRGESAATWKHMGIYCFQTDFLKKMTQWERTPLETSEQLEQLRVLENGHSILCVEAQEESVGVDVPGDVSKVEALLANATSF